MGNMIFAASDAASKSSGSGSLNILLIIVVLFGVLYFVMIRPQRNRQRRAQEQQNAVTPGTRVRTTAGMYATVVGVDGDDVILEVAPGVEVRYIKRAIMQVLPDEAPEPDYAADDDESAAAHVDAPPADAEAADHEAADHEAADHEAADHEAADQETSGHEAAGHEGADHDGDEPSAHAAGDESPNGSPAAAADERRTQGSV
jgi:preprotein translocase subunit YajC